jgi:DNA-binding SARP family transcriptional activator
LQSLSAAFELYRGPFLPAQDAYWALAKRETLRQLFVEVGLELSSLHLAANRTGEALNCCLRILAEEPCLEEVHRLAMRIHAASGNRAAIVNQFEQCRRIIKSEIDAEPSPQTIELFKNLMARS